jgi:hypothetical protein
MLFRETVQQDTCDTNTGTDTSLDSDWFAEYHPLYTTHRLNPFNL